MKLRALSQALGTLLLIAGLAACGGGGSGDAAGTSNANGSGSGETSNTDTSSGDGSSEPGSGSSENVGSEPGDSVVVTEAGKLITFNRSTPTQAETVINIQGLASGDFIVGMDVNPQDNKFYGYTYKGAVVLLDILTGIATPLQALQPDPNHFFDHFPTEVCDVDFNPLTGLMHVFTKGGEQYLINLNGGLIYKGDGFAGGLSGSGFSDAFWGGASTTLSLIDGASGYLFLEADPSTGHYGSPIDLGFNALGAAGFDLSAENQHGYTLLLINDAWEFIQLDLAGEASSHSHFLGKLAGLAHGDKPTAMALLQPLVEAFALSEHNELLSFFPHNPQEILSRIPIKGLFTGENVLGIDMRPQDGFLYCLTDLGRMLKIDPHSGDTFFVTQLAQTFKDGLHSLDWDPAKDMLHVITEQGEHFELSPSGVKTGLTSLLDLLGDLISLLLGYAPDFEGLAFDHNFPGADKLSRLFSFDMAADKLLGLLSSSLFQHGDTGLPDGAHCAGFDIIGGFNGLPLAAIQPEPGQPFYLHFVDLKHGGVRLIKSLAHSQIGHGADKIKDIALHWKKHHHH